MHVCVCVCVCVYTHSGAVLGAYSILKEDNFPGMLSTKINQAIEGAPNFRCVWGGHTRAHTHTVSYRYKYKYTHTRTHCLASSPALQQPTTSRAVTPVCACPCRSYAADVYLCVCVCVCLCVCLCTEACPSYPCTE